MFSTDANQVRGNSSFDRLYGRMLSQDSAPLHILLLLLVEPRIPTFGVCVNEAVSGDLKVRCRLGLGAVAESSLPSSPCREQFSRALSRIPEALRFYRIACSDLY